MLLESKKAQSQLKASRLRVLPVIMCRHFNQRTWCDVSNTKTFQILSTISTKFRRVRVRVCVRVWVQDNSNNIIEKNKKRWKFILFFLFFGVCCQWNIATIIIAARPNNNFRLLFICWILLINGGNSHQHYPRANRWFHSFIRWVS